MGNVIVNLLRRLRPGSPEVRRLGIDIVHGCQLRCVGCPNSGLAPKVGTMDREVFLRCLRNVDVARVGHLRLFNFGEPLLHPDVPGLLRLVGEQTWSVGKVEISTNAQYHDFVMLAEIFRTGVLDTLVVSCDGDGIPADYERLRPPGKWDKLMEFLVKAKELRDRHSPRTDLKTRTACESAAGKQRWLDVLSPMGWRPKFREWLALPEALQNLSGVLPRGANGVCTYMKKNHLYVDVDGSVVPCCMHPRAFVLGNLTRSRFSEIRDGESRREFLRVLGTDRDTLAICAKCGA